MSEKVFKAPKRLEDWGKWIRFVQGRWAYAKCPFCGTTGNNLTNYCPQCGRDMRKEYPSWIIRGLIGSYPTVDAVPVVRCQNCRHWKQHTGVDSEGNLIYLDSGNCGLRVTNKNDYCFLAVRREDNE